MISDDSSSDSETGRFKGRSTQAESVRTRTKDDFRSSRRDRPTENDRFRREFDRKRDDRDRYDRRSRERHRYSRHSSPHKRRHSREKSQRRRSAERPRHGGDYRPKQKDRSKSRERLRRSESKSKKTSEPKQDLKEEIQQSGSRHKSSEKNTDKVKEKSSSPDPKSKKSIVHKPPPTENVKRPSDSPIIVEDHVASDVSEEVQPGSYYSMVPAVVKEISEESSEIDSSDDERLRAKLLNLEKELQKTRKKKHKKKKRKSSKPNKDKDNDTSNSVEVTSTTDIQGKVIDGDEKSQNEVAEVTSTQKQKDSSEEGEISSDDNSQSSTNIDPSDLRHKLKRTKNTDSGSNPDVCGPALPPHLEKRFRSSPSPGTEGPALPPHLKQKDKTVGPSIPDELRKVLAENGRPVLKYESSDEDGGIGPLPAGTEDRWSEAHQRLEERALHMKIKQLDGQTLDSSKIKSREEWMLQLPEGKTKYLGLEARTFRAKAGPDMSDRSSWTDTPEEKAKKAAGIVTEDPEQALQREARERFITTRDEEQEKAVRRHKKKHKREESLLDIHQKKLKKKKKKEDKDDDKKERRPFSRDVDLQVNRFDEAQKKSIIKKAQGLNTRFSQGEAKYL